MPFAPAHPRSKPFQFAGMVTETLEYPLDLAKVRLQAQVLLPAPNQFHYRFNGTLDVLKHTWKDEGFKGLYRVCLVIFTLSLP